MKELIKKTKNLPDDQLNDRDFFKKHNKRIKKWKTNKLLFKFLEQYKDRIFQDGNPFIGTNIQYIQKNYPDVMKVEIKKVYKKLLNIIGDVGFLAGGSIKHLLSKTKEKFKSDYDIYSFTKENRYEIVKRLINRGFKVSFINQNCINFSKPHKVQVITSFYGNPNIVVDEFDFNICRVALSKENNEYVFYYDKDFFNDEKKKKLTIKTIQCPIGVIRRVIKYSKKNYRISNIQILKLYEYYIDMPQEKRRELVNYIERIDNGEELSQEEFEELEAIMVKVD